MKTKRFKTILFVARPFKTRGRSFVTRNHKVAIPNHLVANPHL